MILACNIKGTFFLFQYFDTIAEQRFRARPQDGYLLTLEYHFWSQSQ